MELLTLAELTEMDDQAFGGTKPKRENDVEELTNQHNIDEIVETWKEGVLKLGEAAMKKYKDRIAFIRQQQYADDPKRVFNSLISYNTPMSEIDPDTLQNFFSDRWKKAEDLIIKSDYQLNNTMDEKMIRKFIEELLDENKMKILLRIIGNLSAPGLDDITNPIIKIERESMSRAMIEIMKQLMESGYYPEDWKGTRTILI